LERDEYISRLVKELRDERIISNSDNGKLVVTSFDKAYGRGYIDGKVLAMYRETHLANHGKFKRWN